MLFRISTHVKGIEKLVDKQVKEWLLSTQQKESMKIKPEETHPVITISREKGTEGSVTGEKVASKLKYHFLTVP